jgi:putative transcriptional regulator
MAGSATGSETWANFGLGAHDPAVVLLIETQAALRDDVRSVHDAVGMLGGDALETEAVSMMNDNALSSVFAQIDALETGVRNPRKAARIAGAALQELLELPEPVREHALIAVAGAGWQMAGPGLKVMNLDVGSSATVQLLRIEPGHGAPSHDHSGVEHTLVLTGAFRDESGLYEQGDLSTRNAGEVHRPIAEPGEICFALAVAEGPIQLTGPLGLLQRLFTRH